MKLETLRAARIAAMKDKDKMRKDVISSLEGAIKKMAIDKKCDRDNIPEAVVDEAILKEQKSMQESIDTCPKNRPEILVTYIKKKEIIDEFAPVLVTDKEEIAKMISSLGVPIMKGMRGTVMKELKGKVDMKIANEVFVELMKG